MSPEDLVEVAAMRSDLRDIVREAMSRQGVSTYAQLSERSGVSKAQISKYVGEPKDYQPKRLSLDVIERLFDVLDVDSSAFRSRYGDLLDAEPTSDREAADLLPSRARELRQEEADETAAVDDPTPSTREPPLAASNAIEDDEGRRATSTNPGVDSSHVRVRLSRAAVLRVLVVAVVVVLIGAGAAAWLTPRAVRSPTPARPSAIAEPFFSEDFNGTQLDLEKWLAPSDSAHLFVRERVLNLIGSTDPGQEVDTDLAPRSLGTFHEVDFTLSVLGVENPGAGGGSIVVTEQNGRTHEMVFGPSPGPIPLLAAALICSRPTCRQYDDYDPPPPTRPFETFVPGEVVPVRIIQNQSDLTFWLRGVLIGRAEVSQPLAGFRLNAYATPGERWHIALDAVRVYR